MTGKRKGSLFFQRKEKKKEGKEQIYVQTEKELLLFERYSRESHRAAGISDDEFNSSSKYSAPKSSNITKFSTLAAASRAIL